MSEWAKAILKIASKCNSFIESQKSSRSKCVRLYCCGERVGIIKPSLLPHLLFYRNVFSTDEEGNVIISDKFLTVKERTDAVNGVLKDLRRRNIFSCLEGWRNENYAVSTQFGKPAFFHCERAGARLLGILQYGVHLNVFTLTSSGEYMLWIARRSDTKPTYPGMLDNTVAGAIAAGTSVFESLIRECEEEASIGAELASCAKATGTISYFHEAPDGLQPETEFIYELEVSMDFVPKPRDGEVSEFYRWDVDKVKLEMAKEAFKPNCALVILQFLLRHGLVTPTEESEYERLASCSHVNFYSEDVV